jgi:hypothetical protein
MHLRETKLYAYLTALYPVRWPPLWGHELLHVLSCVCEVWPAVPCRSACQRAKKQQWRDPVPPEPEPPMSGTPGSTGIMSGTWWRTSDRSTIDDGKRRTQETGQVPRLASLRSTTSFAILLALRSRVRYPIRSLNFSNLSNHSSRTRPWCSLSL